MYIGQSPSVGAYKLCDAITTSSTATFNLTVGSVATSPETASNCIVSLNGVIQAPISAFTIVGSTIVFNSALTSVDVIDFILILGDVMSIGTPSDDTVTLAKMASGTDGNIISYDASGNPVAIATGNDGQVLTSAGAGQPPAFEALSAGKILQVVTVNKSDTFTTTSTMVDITGLTVDITPSATSSKILVLSAVNGSQEVGVTRAYLTLVRDSTAIFIGDAAGSRSRWSGSLDAHADSLASGTVSSCYVDSPSTTSAVTYKWQGGNGGNAGTFYINRTDSDGDDATQIRMASTITLMEIGA